MLTASKYPVSSVGIPVAGAHALAATGHVFEEPGTLEEVARLAVDFS